MSNNSKQPNDDVQTSTSSLQSGDTAMLAGRPVSRIGYGAMQLPGPHVWGPPRDRKMAIAVLRKAMELGVNHIDTAQFYGPDVANELIREALYPYPENLVLVSKVGAERDKKGGWIPTQYPKQLRKGVEDNLRSLKVNQLDVVNLRKMDTLPDGSPLPAESLANFEDQLAEMIALREEGKIRGIGVSNISLEQLQQALPAGIACVQNEYSLLNRDGEKMLDLCLENDIAWVPYFPLGSAGIPGIKSVTQHPVVTDLASTLKATPAQIGLAWLLAHAPNILLIPGTSNPEHLAENMAARDVVLDEAAMHVLDRLSNAE